MADNVVITPGTGTTIAADELVDATLGTIKVQYVKLMDGTLDGTSKASVSANGLKVDNRSLYPESTVIFDDIFTNGFGLWEELYNSPGDFARSLSGSLSLSTHGAFSPYALLLQTGSIQRRTGVSNTDTGTYLSQCYAIRRAGHLYLGTNTPSNILVDSEWWFGYTTENNADGTFNGNSYPGAPSSITFGIDSEINLNTTTALSTSLPKRAFFQALWAPVDASLNYSADWKFGQVNGTYGVGGYIAPDSNFPTSGYKTQFIYNQNKRNVNYVKLTVNAATGAYVSMIANNLFYDLTTAPNPIGSAMSLTDPVYNDYQFGEGLNMTMQINNRSNTNVTATGAELHRARMSYRLS